MKNQRSIMIIFIVISALIVWIPLLNTNIKKNQISEIDNRNLVEFPDHIGLDFPAHIEKYVSDRLGFREEMITGYQTICDKIFHKLVHPSYIYGKKGHIYTNWDLVTYQHLDVNKKFVSDFVAYLDNLSELCKDYGAEFIFFLAPNKESIYPEFYPSGYNVKEQPNRSDEIMNLLSGMKINYIDPRKKFKEEPGYTLYNKKYDAGHWNDRGAFFGISLIIDKLNSLFPEMGFSDINDFNINNVKMKYLPASRFIINEEVPMFELKDTGAIEESSIFDTLELVEPNLYHAHYLNEMQGIKPRILVFGDSFFENSAKYYLNHCSELLLLHSHNMVEAEYYIQNYKPDVVIFEAVERVLEVPEYIDEERVSKRFKVKIDNGKPDVTCKDLNY